MSNLGKNAKTGAISFWTDRKHLFNKNMGNFKFNFLSRGQLGSLSIDNAFLTVFKMLTGMSASLVTLFLHLLLERSAEIVLIT